MSNQQQVNFKINAKKKNGQSNKSKQIKRKATRCHYVPVVRLSLRFHNPAIMDEPLLVFLKQTRQFGGNKEPFEESLTFTS